MDTSEIKVDIVIYRGQLNLLMLHCVLEGHCCSRFANVFFSVIKIHAYCNSLDPQVTFWCYGVTKTS